MTEWIKKSDVLDLIEKIHPIDFGSIFDYEEHRAVGECLREVRQGVKSILADDVVEVMRGEWIEGKSPEKCSLCGKKGFPDWKYCPNCGADMREDEHDISGYDFGCIFYANRKCNLDGDFCPEGPGCPYECHPSDSDRIRQLVQEHNLIGKTVYETNKRGFISTYKVISVHVSEWSVLVGWDLLEGIYSNVNGFEISALGKTVFLTREEAEKALEENRCGE